MALRDIMSALRNPSVVLVCCRHTRATPGFRLGLAKLKDGSFVPASGFRLCARLVPSAMATNKFVSTGTPTYRCLCGVYIESDNSATACRRAPRAHRAATVHIVPLLPLTGRCVRPWEPRPRCWPPARDNVRHCARCTGRCAMKGKKRDQRVSDRSSTVA